jgi:hypothetical protein
MKRLRRAAIIGAAALAAGAIGIRQSLPPAAQMLTATSSGVRGAIHVHTRRSDGSSTPEQVAAAAARAGLQFVILTDHADESWTPARPAYHSGVLVVDAVEISGEDGHVLALGLPKAPYPLAGEVRDIVDDIARMGAMSIAAHPGSMKPQLRWTEWTSPFDGLEWLNGDSELRDERWGALARVLFTYPFRPTSSIGTLLDRPDAILRRWDALTARRRVVGLAGTDAHARLDVSGDDRPRVAVVDVPGYEAVFKTFTITAAGIRFAKNADADSAALLDAIRRGHVYSTVDALATPGAVAFTASRGGTRWQAGDFVPPEGGDIELRVDSNAPSGSRVVLFRNGAVAETADRTMRRVVAAEPAVYRVEIQLPGAPGDPPVPWIVTNPIYVRSQDAKPLERGEPSDRAPLYENGDAHGWRIEKSPRSKAALDVTRAISGTELLLRWGIGGTLSESPYAAFAMPAGTLISGYDRLLFTARADKPMRLSVQFRTGNGERWRRSVYLDETARPVAVFFDDVRPAGATGQRRLPLGQVRDVLFVVDTVNTKPGSAGQFWIDDVQYGR